MDVIINILITIGIFILALLIMVFTHELGHFLAAKLFGMRVERFSLGFPPRIWGFKKGETDYCISATPLGGYVKISGMIDESMDTEHLDKEPEPWEFRSKPVWQRIIVITAGVIFNLILAAVIFACLAFTQGQSKIPAQNLPPIYVPDSTVARQVGFKTGDKLVAVNGTHPKYFSGFFSQDQLTKSKVAYRVIRDGQQKTITMPDSLLDEIGRGGFISTMNILPSKISQVQSGSPADTAGIKKGDEVVAVNGQPVHYWMQLVEKIKGSKGTLNMTLKQGNQTKDIRVTPNKNHIVGIMAVQPAQAFKVVHIKYGFFGAVSYGVEKTGSTVQGIVQSFVKLFSGAISVRQNLGGPVAIASITRQATEANGAVGFWNITAFLSITLAIMNILPIPVLDGGHLVFLLYEGITRRRPSAKVRMVLQQIGFVLIIALFIFVTFNDILRQF